MATNTRTALFARNTPGGVFTIDDLAEHPGNIFFVDSTHANKGVTTGHGTSPDSPLSTLAYAFSSDLLASGDTVYLMPSHAESVIAAAGIVCDIAGVRVIGLGNNRTRPTITFNTDVAADIDIDAANITFRNIRFIGNIAALAAPIDVNAAGFTMEDCDFYVAGATTDIDITVITDDAANDMVIRRCSFNYDCSNEATGVAVSAASTEVIRLVGADRAVIDNNYFSGNFATSVINGITTKSMDVRISNNRIYNDQTANVAGIVDLVAGCTGVISDNVGFHGYATDLATTIDPSSCAMVRNYFSNVVTEAGGLVGTAST